MITEWSLKLPWQFIHRQKLQWSEIGRGDGDGGQTSKKKIQVEVIEKDDVNCLVLIRVWQLDWMELET